MNPAQALLALIDPDLVRDAISGAGLALDTQFFRETSSTNDRARDYLRGARPGAPVSLISAESQSAGRGRFGRTWVSPPSMNLLFSLAVPTSRAEGLAPEVVNLAVADAVCAAIQAADPSLAPTIKWPNDVELNGAKVAGALTEVVSGKGGSGPLGHVVGVGVNVNIPAAAWPADLRGAATSLLIETRRPWSREALLADIVIRILNDFAKPEPERSAEAFAAWRARLNCLGRPVRVRMGESEINGVALEARPDGALILRPDAGGRDLMLRGGEVSMRPAAPKA